MSFVILAGPSCVGKGPLMNTVRNSFPDIRSRLSQAKITLTSSRDPRPGESEGNPYYFRSREVIAQMRSDPQFIVFPVRSDLQAIDVKELEQAMRHVRETPQAIGFLEIACSALAELAARDDLFAHLKSMATTVFLSPLSAQEILGFQPRFPGNSLPEAISSLMTSKQLHRLIRARGPIDSDPQLPEILADINERARMASLEMAEAIHFDHVIVNHDGESHPNWGNLGYPNLAGDARKAVESMEAILRGVPEPRHIERWSTDVVAKLQRG